MNYYGGDDYAMHGGGPERAYNTTLYCMEDGVSRDNLLDAVTTALEHYGIESGHVTVTWDREQNAWRVEVDVCVYAEDADMANEKLWLAISDTDMIDYSYKEMNEERD